MAILLKHEIIQAQKDGKVNIVPFNEENVGPNSIDVTLSNILYTYTPIEVKRTKINEGFYNLGVPKPQEYILLDPKEKNKYYSTCIPSDGLIILPGVLYIGGTVEVAGSSDFIPMYEGRSSMARLGIQSHISAGFGDIGFNSQWTLEITVVHPTIIYPGMRIGQVYFHKPSEESISGLKSKHLYHGKYQGQVGPQVSKSWDDKEYKQYKTKEEEGQ